MSKDHVKMDSTFDEVYALLVVDYLYPGFVTRMRKWESPDWKSDEDIYGLNAPHFTICRQNYLFEFGTGCFAAHDKVQFSEGIKALAPRYMHTFDKIIVSTYDNVFCFFPDGTHSEHTVPVHELTQTARLYRKISSWEKGSLFSDIQQQVNDINQNEKLPEE